MQNFVKTLTEYEATILLEKLFEKREVRGKGQKSYRNYTMAVVMLEAGIRVGELVQLRVKDLWYDGEPAKTLQIRAEIAKRGIPRAIPCSELLIKALHLYKGKATFLLAALGDTPAFPALPNLTAITVRQVQRIIKVAAMESIHRSIHPHILRHTFGSRLMRVANARVVQQLLGHQNLSSTQIYCHPNGDDLKKAIESVGSNTPSSPS